MQKLKGEFNKVKVCGIIRRFFYFLLLTFDF